MEPNPQSGEEGAMMNAMVIDRVCDLSKDARPLRAVRMPVPEAGPGEILIEVSACGVCHTELDEIEGRTPPPVFPMVPGHQVVGRVAGRGEGADRFSSGDRVGVAWIYSACGECSHCRDGVENLCADFRATGRDAHGGYAQYMVVPQAFAFAIPGRFGDIEAAPLLCAGAVGYRSLILTGIRDGDRIGLTGFGASGHLVLKMVRHRYPRSSIYVFARNPEEREFAGELGAVWSGDTLEQPPEKLHCIIDTTPAWRPVVAALKALRPGGRLVINAIRKEAGDRDVLRQMDYAQHLWLEKEVKSVANVTRRDVEAFLDLAAAMGIRPEVRTYPLGDANRALTELRNRRIKGAKVLDLKA
jgi:propanol-preferring alcohol dehydrogenase